MKFAWSEATLLDRREQPGPEVRRVRNDLDAEHLGEGHDPAQAVYFSRWTRPATARTLRGAASQMALYRDDLDAGPCWSFFSRAPRDPRRGGARCVR